MELSYNYSNSGLYPCRYLRTSHTKDDQPRTSLANLTKGYTTKGISKATSRKIRLHSLALAYTANNVRVRNSKGEYVQHLCTFITLTLPSTQHHTDQEITKKVLGAFFEKCRKIGVLANYVWRAEKQKNGNIHYHVITDTYIYFAQVRRLWLLSLERLGYVSAYRRKFGRMSLQEYAKQSFNQGKEWNSICATYAKNVREKWSSPPCVHTSPLQAVGEVAKYISKYISKTDEDNDNFVKGRCWAASDNVRKVAKALSKDEEFSKIWYHVSKEVLRKEVFVSDFYSVCLCTFQSFKAWYPDIVQPFIARLRTFIQPCIYYLKSLGKYPKKPVVAP